MKDEQSNDNPSIYLAWLRAKYGNDSKAWLQAKLGEIAELQNLLADCMSDCQQFKLDHWRYGHDPDQKPIGIFGA